MIAIDHSQFVQLCAALDSCVVGMPEADARAFGFEFTEASPR